MCRSVYVLCAYFPKIVCWQTCNTLLSNKQCLQKICFISPYHLFSLISMLQFRSKHTIFLWMSLVPNIWLAEGFSGLGVNYYFLLLFYQALRLNKMNVIFETSGCWPPLAQVFHNYSHKNTPLLIRKNTRTCHIR